MELRMDSDGMALAALALLPVGVVWLLGWIGRVRPAVPAVQLGNPLRHGPPAEFSEPHLVPLVALLAVRFGPVLLIDQRVLTPPGAT